MKLNLVLVCLLVTFVSTARISRAKKSESKGIHMLRKAQTHSHKEPVISGEFFNDIFTHLTSTCLEVNNDKYKEESIFALHMVCCQNYTTRFYAKAVKCQIAGPASAAINKSWIEAEMKANRENGDDLFMKKAGPIRKALLTDPAKKPIVEEANQRFFEEMKEYTADIGFDWVAWTDKPANVCN